MINADGSYTFTPALNYTGPVPPANYIVTDGDDTNNDTYHHHYRMRQSPWAGCRSKGEFVLE
ncbi:cadherin-like domain-containing protein [Aeromonas sp. Marseille-Q7275]